MSDVSHKLTVWMGGHDVAVGTLFFEARAGRQTSTFRYSQAWRDDPHSFAIAPSMPLSRETTHTAKSGRPHSFAFAAPIADTCPDNWGQAILRRDRAGRSGPVTDIEFLLGVDDFSRPGALRFADETGLFQQSRGQGRPRTPPLLMLADLARSSRALEGRLETDRDLARLRGTGSSLGGARPKASVVDDDGTLLIAKFPARNEELPTEQAEVLTLMLARAAGLNVPDARLATPSEWGPIALIKRFDRTPEGRRIPFISAQTMLEQEPGETGTYTMLAAAIREHGSQARKTMRELFSRVAFTVLVSNTDDHLKNHGFTHDGHGRWTLSPMFDVNPAPLRESGLKTWISEGSGDAAELEALIEVAPEFGLDRSNAAALISQIAQIVADQWEGTARRLHMEEKFIAAYRPAFQHEQSRYALSLRAAPLPAPEEDDEPDVLSPGPS